MPAIPADQLQDFATSLLQAGGANPAEAACVGASLVSANLRGYESHGVMRIPSYIDFVRNGVIVSGADFTVLSEGDSRLAADANWGFGQVQASELTSRLVAKAQRAGVAIGTMFHSGHIGRLGEYCERVAEQNLITMMMVNSHGAAARVAPPGGKAPRLSTNPLAIGVPHPETPLILDFSTSATAEGKVRVKKIAGETCPEGWLLDSNGNPTTDPNELYADPPGSILPMGGPQAYKGFGLGLMIEIFTGAISGGACAQEPRYPKNGNCVFMMIVDPAGFGGAERFGDEVGNLVGYMRDCPRAEGVNEIMLPGDPERKVLADRTANGIFLDDENWSKLTALAAELSVAAPQ